MARGAWIQFDDAPRYRFLIRAPSRWLRRRVEDPRAFSAVLLNWEGVTRGGDPVPCTRANAERFLRSFPVMHERLAELARDPETFINPQELLA